MKWAFLLVMFTISTASATPVVQAWLQRYHGAGAGDDGAVAVATDTNKNVFVTGFSLTTNGYPDYNYVTIKYSCTGLPLWTNSYDGLIHSDDSPEAMALDRDGNVFVTGLSYGPTGDVDFATIAYSNGGMPLWTNFYVGGPESDNEGQGIAVDSHGNIYVAGYSGDGNDYSFVLIKYSNAGGPEWTNIFAGSQGAHSAMVIDSQDNVLVTGASADANGYSDFETLKFSNDGTPLWTNYYGEGFYYDYPAGVAVDQCGNVFVIGSSYGNGSGYDFATLAYSSNGVSLWTNRYSGPENNWDIAKAIAVSKTHLVFVTGASAVELAGPPHYTTIAYSNEGVPLWTNIYTGGVADDEPEAMTLDKFGNVIVTGYSTGAGTSSDIATVEYSESGTPVWTNRYDGGIGDPDQGNAVTTDRSGNVVVAGFSYGSGDDADFATIKYSLVLPDILQIAAFDGQAVLTWTNTAFSLQSAPAVDGVFTNISDATSPYTNSIIEPQEFFRLIAN